MKVIFLMFEVMNNYNNLDTMSDWLKEVKKAERYIGWKDDKLYDKNGVLLCEKARYEELK